MDGLTLLNKGRAWPEPELEPPPGAGLSMRLCLQSATELGMGKQAVWKKTYGPFLCTFHYSEPSLWYFVGLCLSPAKYTLSGTERDSVQYKGQI